MKNFSEINAARCTGGSRSAGGGTGLVNACMLQAGKTACIARLTAR